MRILKVVDDALAAALAANRRSEAEASTIKEAEAALRTELAVGLKSLSNKVGSADELTYEQLLEMLS